MEKVLGKYVLLTLRYKEPRETSSELTEEAENHSKKTFLPTTKTF